MQVRSGGRKKQKAGDEEYRMGLAAVGELEVMEAAGEGGQTGWSWWRGHVAKQGTGVLRVSGHGT